MAGRQNSNFARKVRGDVRKRFEEVWAAAHPDHPVTALLVNAGQIWAGLSGDSETVKFAVQSFADSLTAKNSAIRKLETKIKAQKDELRKLQSPNLATTSQPTEQP